MRYAIGAKTVDRDTRKQNEGIYAYGFAGMPFLLTKQTEKLTNVKVPIFTDIKDAQAFLSRLSKRYKESFQKEAWLTKSNRNQFGFYLLKVDSSNFPLEISDDFSCGRGDTKRDFPTIGYYSVRRVKSF